MDVSLFRWINDLPHPAWSEMFALFFDYLGRERLFLFLAGIALLSGFVLKNKKQIQLAALFAGMVLATSGVSFIVKQLLHRARPYAVLEDVYLIGYASGGFSFPSNHAALFAAVAYFMQRVYKKGFFFWWALALLGGAARVYQGVHYPADVLGGWLIGGFVSWGVISLFIMFFKRVEI